MKKLTEKEVREELKGYPYVATCNTFRLMDFTQRRYEESVRVLHQLEKYTKKGLLTNWNGVIKTPGHIERGTDGVVMSVDLAIGENVCSKLNESINKTMVQFYKDQVKKCEYNKNLFDSMVIAYAETIK
jgi:hypothetical protein